MENILAGLVTRIDHIGLCVDRIDTATELWSSLLGASPAHRERVAPQRAEVAFFDFPPPGAAVELVAPTDESSGLAKFLEKRGAGLHHIAFEVSDLTLALERLRAAGVSLIDREPRAGARGHRVAFLHPKAAGGTLVELVEHERAG